MCGGARAPVSEVCNASRVPGFFFSWFRTCRFVDVLVSLTSVESLLVIFDSSGVWLSP